jgi:hypothetical protein
MPGRYMYREIGRESESERERERASERESAQSCLTTYRLLQQAHLTNKHSTQTLVS